MLCFMELVQEGDPREEAVSGRCGAVGFQGHRRYVLGTVMCLVIRAIEGRKAVSLENRTALLSSQLGAPGSGVWTGPQEPLGQSRRGR